MIKVENLHKSFGDLEVLKGVSEHIKKGEVIKKVPENMLLQALKEELDKLV